MKSLAAGRKSPTLFTKMSIRESSTASAVSVTAVTTSRSRMSPATMVARPPARGDDLVVGDRGSVGIDVGNHHVRTCRRQPPTDAAADAQRATRDHGYLSREPHPDSVLAAATSVGRLRYLANRSASLVDDETIGAMPGSALESDLR